MDQRIFPKKDMAGPSVFRSIIATVLAALLLALVSADPGYYAHETVSGDYAKRIDVDGRRRDFLLHLPTGYDSSGSLPLVLVFHGSSASASVIERETSFDHIADSLGFVVAYPEGLHRGWNIGECCRYSYQNRVNDMAFVGALIGHLERGLHVDSSRVYAAGYSDGGTLSMLLACRLPAQIAAVGTVSGTLFNPLPRCNLTRPVPVIVIHGTGDTHIPYGGQHGTSANSRAQHETLSASQVTQFWVQHDNCAVTGTESMSGRVVRMKYECPDSASVVFYTIRGGEHGWPGGGRGWIFSPRPPSDMSATDSIAKFFLDHRIRWH